ncbi:hypothetical protein L596_028827 [Steinernema carpocapsae]|uniref:Uncharacterized protein n=1 Tax=Steinernema carpocapsae TaxID=34508 RepID=A0A4U5LZI3_STECR|nr:hypothetical protein L596_028827 [Steinernema carpocapsae]
MAFHVFVKAFLALGSIVTTSSAYQQPFIIKWTQNETDVVVKGDFYQFEYVVSAKDQLEARNEDWCPMAYEIIFNREYHWKLNWDPADQDTFDSWVRKDDCMISDKRHSYSHIVTSMPNSDAKKGEENRVNEDKLLSEVESTTTNVTDEKLMFWTIFAGCFLGFLVIVLMIAIFLVVCVPIEDDSGENKKEERKEREEPGKEEV